MFDYPVYLLYRAGTDLLVLLPLPFLFAMGQICGAIAWRIPAAIPETCSAKCAHRFWRRTFRDRDAPDRAPAFSMAGSEFALQREVYPHADGKNLEARTLWKTSNSSKTVSGKRSRLSCSSVTSVPGSFAPDYLISRADSGPRPFINASAIGTLIGTFGRPAADLVWRSLSAAKGSAKRLSCYAAAAGSGF